MSGIDNGEEKIERVTSNVATEGTRVAITFVASRVGKLTQAMVSKGLHMGVSSLQWAAAAVTKPGGEVSMKELAELPSQIGREVVSLDDKDVMRVLEKNLKINGVHYAIEREKIDGKIQHTLHVRGDDAKVVEHSLEHAAEAIDAKREHTQERQVARQPERTVDAEAPKQQPSLPKTDEDVKSKKPSLADGRKRTKAETAKFQKELRAKVNARAAKIKAEAPKTVPKANLKIPVPGLKL